MISVQSNTSLELVLQTPKMLGPTPGRRTRNTTSDSLCFTFQILHGTQVIRLMAPKSIIRNFQDLTLPGGSLPALPFFKHSLPLSSLLIFQFYAPYRWSAFDSVFLSSTTHSLLAFRIPGDQDVRQIYCRRLDGGCELGLSRCHTQGICHEAGSRFRSVSSNNEIRGWARWTYLDGLHFLAYRPIVCSWPARSDKPKYVGTYQQPSSFY